MYLLPVPIYPIIVAQKVYWELVRECAMRTGIKDRYYRTYTYQDVDRVPDIEFGYWPQTIRRWLKEGLTLKLTLEETEAMFSRKLDNYFGFERE